MDEYTDLPACPACGSEEPDCEPGCEAVPQKTWTTEELQQDFEVIGFAAPFVVVRRKEDGQVGTLEFRHRPRVYFDFVPKEDR